MSATVPFVISTTERCELPFDTPCAVDKPTYNVPWGNRTVTSLVLRKSIDTVEARSYVYRGTLDNKPVIAKFSYDDKKFAKYLKTEANNYNLLKDLQGTCIPRFYTYLEGSILTSDDERPKDLSCIIIEDCGSNLPDLDEIGENERIEIFEQLVKIHLSEYSVRYNRENIVGSPGKYRIIDFHAIDGHDCLWSKFCKEQDLLSYNERTFPCESLTLAGRDLEIWEKSEKYIRILGKSYYGQDAEEFPPKKIVPYLVPYLIPITFMDIGANRETVEESLKQFKKNMDEDPNCDIGELIGKYQTNSSYTLENSDGEQFRPRFMVYKPTSP